MLSPRWVQPRVGPLLRGGLDPRAYLRQILLFGLFQPRRGEVRGARRFYVRRRYPALGEPESFCQRMTELDGGERGLFNFCGDGDHFRSLQPWRSVIREELLAATRRRWRDLVASFGEVPIVLNVRCAHDFPQWSLESAATGPVRTPLRWFIGMLRLVRGIVGAATPAYVVSDGTADQLKPLLQEGAVHFVRPGCAISDLLIVSRARVLLASGGSSFSAWGAFLGSMPVATLPKQSLDWFRVASPDRDFVGTVDPDEPDEAFMESCRRALSG